MVLVVPLASIRRTALFTRSATTNWPSGDQLKPAGWLNLAKPEFHPPTPPSTRLGAAGVEDGNGIVGAGQEVNGVVARSLTASTPSLRQAIPPGFKMDPFNLVPLVTMILVRDNRRRRTARIGCTMPLVKTTNILVAES